MTDLKDIASYLESKGRYGDQVLVHLNPIEVDALAALSPTGELTINPETGLQEAFLPLLAPILGGFLGSMAAPTLGISAVLGGALGSGLASTAATGDLGKGIMSGLLSYGMGSAVDLLGSGAGAAAGAAGGAGGVVSPEMTQGIFSAGEGAATQAAAGGGNSLGGTAGMGAALSAPPATPGLGERLANAGQGLLDPGALKNTFLTNATKTTLPIGLGLYGMAGDMFGQQNGEGAPQQGYQPSVGFPTSGGYREYTPPTGPYGREKGREWTWFTPTQYADGGQVEQEIAEQEPFSVEEMEEMLLNYEAALAAKRGLTVEDMGSRNPFFDEEPPILQYKRGGYVSGPGGGLADAIPARIDGRQPAALSSGEYVVPAAALAGLGDGSAEEGTRKMDKVVDHGLARIARQAQTQKKRRQAKFADGGKVKDLDGVMMALIGERMEDARGNVYESVGPNMPHDFDVNSYGGKFPTYDYPDGVMKDVDLEGKRFFRTIPPGTLKKHPNGFSPLEWMRLIEGFPTS